MRGEVRPAQETGARMDLLAGLARSATDKPARYGTDIDLSTFEEAASASAVGTLDELPHEVRGLLAESGINTSEEDRSGSFMQLGRSVIYDKVNEIYAGKLEMMDTRDALEKYPEVFDYWWKIISPDQDKYTAFNYLHEAHGYFVRVFKGQKVDLPLQSCILLHENAGLQNVHNIVIVEEGAAVQMISGCTVTPNVSTGIHIGVSEFYIGKNAQLVFSMVHNWTPDFHVRPRTAAVVEDGGSFISNYVLLKPAASVQTFPKVVLKGAKSTARFNTLIYGLKDSVIDTGSEISMEGEESSGEAISRAISDDNSVVYARGTLISHVNSAQAHLDCRGILLGSGSAMHAIPELIADKAPKSHLSHEAAIGPISEEQVEYLMARGFPRDEALSLITTGFLDVGLLGLPKQLEKSIKKMVELTGREAM
ncbi:MAG: SufD family Fe-S cluster assembly protein [Bacillota bacterium]